MSASIVGRAAGAAGVAAVSLLWGVMWRRTLEAKAPSRATPTRPIITITEPPRMMTPKATPPVAQQTPAQLAAEGPRPAAPKKPRSALRVWSVRIALAGLAVAWALTLRPQSLGGPALYMIVRGDSMQPTHDYGDLLLIQAQPSYSIGDVVAYRVPQGELGAGKLVVHRIADLAPEGGFVMRGDNNPADDPWHPGEDLIAGRVVFAVPRLGHVVTMATQPTAAGALGSALVVMYFIGRSPAATRRGNRSSTAAGAAA